MAQGKKSFILYSNWRDTFEALEDSQCAELIRHIFKYVNDENPVLKDTSLLPVWLMMKPIFKSDLEKWDKQRNQRIEAGKKSAESRKRKSTSVNENKRKSTVNVNVNVNVNDILLEKETKELFNEWIDYRNEIKKPIKSEKTKILLAKKIKSFGFEKSKEVIHRSIQNGYQGLFWESNLKASPKKETHTFLNGSTAKKLKKQYG